MFAEVRVLRAGRITKVTARGIITELIRKGALQYKDFFTQWMVMFRKV
jgi:hypothetical protein